MERGKKYFCAKWAAHCVWMCLLLLSWCAHANQDPVAADVAFQVSAEVQDNTLSVSIKVRQNYYLYKDKFALYSNGETLPLALPDNAVVKEDPLFGTVEVYTEDVSWQQPQVDTGNLVLWIQGCWEGGICYPKQRFVIGQNASAAVAQAESNQSSFNQTPSRFTTTQSQQFGSSVAQQALQQPADTAALRPVQAANVAPTDKNVDWLDALTTNNANAFATVLIEEHWWILLLLLFVAGLLLAFTPCVLPMVPIVYGIIMQQKNTVTTSQSGLLVGAYIFGMTLAFSALGIIVALLGANVQQLLQQPVFIGGFVLVLFVLAGSMFNWYHLQLPAKLTQRLASHKYSFGYLGAFLLGAISVLIVGPCITPPLVAVLLFIGQTGDMLLGGLGLAALSLGMGMPLLLVALLTTKALPRAGEWMVLVRGAFGFALLALALYMVDRLVPVWLLLSACACLLLVLAASMWHTRHIVLAFGWRVVLDAIMLLAVLVAFLLLAHAWLPQLDSKAAQPVTGMPTSLDLQGKQYRLSDLQKRIAEHKGKTLVYFTADWCISCRTIKQTVFADDRVLFAFKSIQLLVVDLTDTNQTNQQLQAHYGIIGPPTFVLFDGDGVTADASLVGEINADQLLQLIRG